MTENPRVFDADYSVYVRIVRLCLQLKKASNMNFCRLTSSTKRGPPQSHADSDEAARLKRDDCAQGFLDDAAPL